MELSDAAAGKTLDWVFRQVIEEWVRPDLETPCWRWQGTKAKTGYGLLAIPDGSPHWAQVKMHRLSFYIYYGFEPKPQCNHHCDVRDCVNPDHLYAGTQKDNIRDMEERGRHPHKKKLTYEQMEWAYFLYVHEGKGSPTIGKLFGVDRSVILEAVRYIHKMRGGEGDIIQSGMALEDREEVYTLYTEQKISSVKLAQMFNVVRATIMRAVDHIHQMKTGNPYTFTGKLSQDEKIEVGRLYWDGGLTQKELADMFRVSASTIRNVLKEIGNE